MLLYRYNFVRNGLFLLFFLFSTAVSFAQSLKGKVVDAGSGEPLVGASVKLENTSSIALVKLDGTFVFNKLKAGTYKVSVSYEGYKKDFNVLWDKL